MFIPFLSRRSPKGGGGGRGGSSGGKGGGSSSGGKGSGSSGTKGGSSGGKGKSSSNKPPAYSPGSPPPAYTVSGGKQVRGDPSSAGGGRSYTVGSGQVFSGRSAGGGNRAGIFGGAAAFGGGLYLGSAGFPYLFWPLAFSPPHNHYYGTGPYQPLDNSSRPGGGLESWTLLRASDNPAAANGTAGPTGNTFILYGDSNSVTDLLQPLSSACGTLANVYGANVTVDPSSSVQYYRGSSFGLFLAQYNNSLPVVDGDDNAQGNIPGNMTPAPLPSTVDMAYLNCLNTTIGSSLGLLDSDYATSTAFTLRPPTLFLFLVALLVAWK